MSHAVTCHTLSRVTQSTLAVVGQLRRTPWRPVSSQPEFASLTSTTIASSHQEARFRLRSLAADDSRVTAGNAPVHGSRGRPLLDRPGVASYLFGATLIPREGPRSISRKTLLCGACHLKRSDKRRSVVGIQLRTSATPMRTTAADRAMRRPNGSPSTNAPRTTAMIGLIYA